MGLKFLKVNPPYINQYVECCCTEEKQKDLLKRLKKVVGVTDVAIITEPESLGIIYYVNYFDHHTYCLTII
jgi:hypothetical protein